MPFLRIRAPSALCPSLNPVPEEKFPRSPEDFLPFLAANSTQQRPVIIGGQAVNLWAIMAAEEAPELRQYEPFTSGDCDILGTGEDLLALSRKTGWEMRPAGVGKASPVVGWLKSEHQDGKPLILEVLYSINGLSATEIREDVVPVEYEGGLYYTLSPILLLKGKIANVLSLEQGDRSDFKHIQILIPCVAYYLRTAHERCLQGQMTQRDMVKILNRYLEIVRSRNARTLVSKYDVNLMAGFPACLKNSPLQKVARFYEHQLCPP